MNRGASTVSVILTCYNCSRWVSECVEGVLGQGEALLELIAVDDGSTDNTLAVLRSFDDPRLTVIALESNSGGPSRPRNVALQAAHGDIVTMMDCDDLLKPGALSRVVEFFARAPEAALVFFHSEEFDTVSGRSHGPALVRYQSFWRLSRRAIGDTMAVIDDEETYRQLVSTNFIRTSGTSIRRSVLDGIGQFDEMLKNGDDWDMWLRIAARYPLGFIDEQRAVYRFRANNISHRGYALIPSQLRVLEKQLLSEHGRPARSVIDAKFSERLNTYAWGLRMAGKRREARRQYSRGLGHRVTVAGVRGWFLTWLPSRSAR